MKEAQWVEGVVVTKRDVYNDERGSLCELYRQDQADWKLKKRLDFVQDNLIFSSKRVLRGLHLTLGKGCGKYVTAVRGRIFDVAVDLRPESPTYGKWYGQELSDCNQLQMYVPPGCAHGFLSLTSSIVLYKLTRTWHGWEQASIAWNDPDIGVKWPIRGQPILSESDKKNLTLKEMHGHFGSIAASG